MSHSLLTHYKMQNYVVVERNEVDAVSKVKNGCDLNFFMFYLPLRGFPERDHSKYSKSTSKEGF